MEWLIMVVVIGFAWVVYKGFRGAKEEVQEANGGQPEERSRWREDITWRSFADLRECSIIDFETTGLSPYEDRIITGCIINADLRKVLFEEGKEIDAQMLTIEVNPQIPIPKETTNIHGIKDRDVKNWKTFADCAQQVRDFIGKRPLVAHNAYFDKNLLNSELKRAGVKSCHRNRGYCTMERWTAQFKGRKNLDTVAGYLGMKRKGSKHGSEEDALMVLQLATVLRQIDLEREGS